MAGRGDCGTRGTGYGQASKIVDIYLGLATVEVHVKPIMTGLVTAGSHEAVAQGCRRDRRVGLDEAEPHNG